LSVTRPAAQSAIRSFRLSALTTQRLLVATLFLLLFALAVRIPVDTDTWWHLRSGEYILSHGSVPQTDPFSLTRGGQPWIDQSWLSQIVMVAFYRGLGGSVGLALYTAILATAGMAFIFAICDGNVFLRAFIMVLTASTAAVFWSARPQMASFLLSTVILYLLYTYKKRHVDRLWLIPPIMALWVNLHSGFAIGFIFLGGAIAGEILNRVFKRAEPDVLSWIAIRKLVLITAISGVALLINPYTVKMLTYPFQTAGIGALEQYIQEWASPNFHGHETWPFLVMLFGILAAAGLSKRGWDWTDLVLTGGTAFMALLWQRNFAVFAVVAAPVLARHLNAILDNAGWRLARSAPPRGIAVALNWAILILVLAGALIKIVAVLAPPIVAKAQSDLLPVRAAAYLNAHNPPGPLFNTYNWGGYLLFATPSYPIFVDGRTDLYGDAILVPWRAAILGDPSWRALFDQWKIRLVVIEHDSALAGILRKEAGWQESYADSQASIFEAQALQPISGGS